MKKIMLVVAIIVIAVFACVMQAKADNAYDAVMQYAIENGDNYYVNNEINVYGIYCTIGTIDTKTLREKGATEEMIAEPLEKWFGDFYTGLLQEEYKNETVFADVIKDGEYEDYVIYHVAVAAEIDLVDWLEGEQNIVCILFTVVND